MLTYRNFSLSAYSFRISGMKMIFKNGSKNSCVSCKAIVLAFCDCDKIIGKHILVKRKWLFQFPDSALQVYGLLMFLLWSNDSNAQHRGNL